MAKINQQSGYSLIGWLGLMPFILLGVLVVFFLACELNKTYWDYRVAQMCEEDGGVEIYQHIEVTREEYAQMPRRGGYIDFHFKEKAISNGEVAYLRYQSSPLRQSFPRVNQHVSSIYETLSGEKLAEVTRYSRVGGDFPVGLGPGSSFSCPSEQEIISERKEIESIFFIKE